MGERLSFIGSRKAVKGKAMVANRVLGNPTVRDEKGGFEKHGRCVTSVRAPEFYPTRGISLGDICKALEGLFDAAAFAGCTHQNFKQGLLVTLSFAWKSPDTL